MISHRLPSQEEAESPDQNCTVGAQPDPFHPAPHILVRSWRALWASLRTSFFFLTETEVHVYGFAVAANVLISFFPFLVAVLLLCRYVLHWLAAADIILQTVTAYFPEGFGVDFRGYLLAASSHKNFSILSIFLLLFTANGIFVPLEIALNRIWRVKRNRNFLQSQIISVILIFGCGVLFIASFSATTLNVQLLNTHLGSTAFDASLRSIAFRFFVVLASVLLIFFIYWVLPNTRIPVRRLIPASIAVAVLLEVSKYVNILTWPWLRAKLTKDVPPFVQSISIILWSFIATLIVLAGAEWSARVTVQKLAADSPPQQ